MNKIHSNSFDFNDLISLFFIFEELEEMIKNIGNKAEACRQIQFKYDMPGSVQLLVKKYNRYISAGKRFHKKQLFTAYEEMLFCLLLESFSLMDRPITRMSFLKFIINYRECQNVWNPDGWYSNFIHRYSFLFTTKTINGLNMDRSIKINMNDINNYIESFVSIVRKFRIPHNRFFNIDETRMSINDNNMSISAIVSKIDRNYSFIVPKNS